MKTWSQETWISFTWLQVSGGQNFGPLSVREQTKGFFVKET